MILDNPGQTPSAAVDDDPMFLAPLDLTVRSHRTKLASHRPSVRSDWTSDIPLMYEDEVPLCPG